MLIFYDSIRRSILFLHKIREFYCTTLKHPFAIKKNEFLSNFCIAFFAIQHIASNDYALYSLKSAKFLLTFVSIRIRTKNTFREVRNGGTNQNLVVKFFEKKIIFREKNHFFSKNQYENRDFL